jgi:hypothetical protein
VGGTRIIPLLTLEEYVEALIVPKEEDWDIYLDWEKNWWVSHDSASMHFVLRMMHRAMRRLYRDLPEELGPGTIADLSLNEIGTVIWPKLMTLAVLQWVLPWRE